MKPEPTRTGFRIERDPIGQKQVPAEALYGIQTLRALLESLQIVRNAVGMFDEKCVRLIKPHPEKLREYSERTVGRAALYNDERGFMGAAELANKAIEAGRASRKSLPRNRR